jgi:hypothetical protein
MYEEESRNYVEACPECFKEIEEGWKERWVEYNSGRL